ATGSLLGDALNFPMPHLKGAFGDTELPADFRAPSKTRVPTLLLSGTLDGRTYVDAQWANLRGFTNAHRIIVENAGHNLFMSSNQVQDAIVSFLSGQPVRQTRIRLPNPRFGP
ncbi:MAG: alpha/beta hydrolase, partial [Myxococcota bacterium]